MSSWAGADSEDKPVHVLWKDDERVFYRVWRADANGDQDTFMAVVPAREPPTASSIDRLAHEYELRDHLDGAWSVRPVELVRERGRTMLVLEFPGGQPLDRLIGPPMEVGRFLRIAIASSTALRRLHERGLVHKDIKPSNILADATAGKVWLTGFGIASWLPRERQAPGPPEYIAGTLAYMAPEQTGRMNRSIDSRSDLYALGVTFYEMLTGSLPFTAADPMEWVHCHIARRPVPPDVRVAGIPAPLSAIVMKLLAKTAEDRYQTAAGVEHDLQRCLADWSARGCIHNFALGVEDTPDRLLIPEKLYGREREIETLITAFDRTVKSGTAELVLVSGYSGIGKSSVVNELHKVLVPSRGLFAAGKFDQYKRDIPYATLAQAFQSLVRSLLGKSDAELAQWREAFLEALSPNIPLLSDIVPELRLIVGDQPPVPELPPQDAQRRFQLVLRRFIGVFARPEHPLALFLDDLQWLDAATLDLLEDLFTRSDVQHLMLVGAYRDNEITVAHPLRRMLDVIKSAGVEIGEMTLSPLADVHLKQLMADALRCTPERAAPLARLVHEKTGGNPFFVIQFLYALVDQGLLAFDRGDARWSWDLERIHAKGNTDNVVELMVGKLARLPVETQKSLQLLACVGNIAETAMLSIALGISEERLHATLWEAVRQELIECTGTHYRFAHDRIHEAAYSLIPEALRANAHLRIGRLIAAHTPPEKRDEVIFEIVSQLNRGVRLITSQAELDKLAEFNLIAAKRAKASIAYASALTYLKAGTEQLGPDGWERHRGLSFQLELQRAECELLTGDLAVTEERLILLSTRAENTVERASVACLRMDLYITLNQSDRAVAVCLDYLGHLGIAWSPHPTEEEARLEYARIWSRIGSRSIEELIDLPVMSDPASLATLDVLTKVAPSATFTDANLLSLAVCRTVNLSLEWGNSDGSCAAYVLFGGMIAGPRYGDYKSGFRFGRLGHQLVEQRGLVRYQARTYMGFANQLVPWTKHVLAARDLLRRAFEVANKTGDLTYSGYGCMTLNTNLLAAGDLLVDVQREAENGLEFARKARFGFVADVITAQLGLIRTLRGLTPTFGFFDDERFSELLFERHLASDTGLVLPECWYWIRKLQARFLAGDYESALDASLRAQRLLSTTQAFFETAEYHFYSALCIAAAYDFAFADAHREHFGVLCAHHGQLEIWAENCPENFENRLALVGAEIARIEGRELDAEHLYEQAIRSARENGFVHNEALANELAARFHSARGFETIARAYCREAHDGYLRWGADGKVRQLGEMYPHLREEERAQLPTSTIAATVEQLDLGTVIKVSQAVSGEIEIEKLLDTIMRTAIAQAGAERGLLVLSNEGEPRIGAEATAGGETVVVRISDQPLTAAWLPQSVLQYVLRTREIVILDDAITRLEYAADPYVLERRARSILCVPLITQAKLIGALYLENNLAPRVFAAARVAVLKLLASQAAIALENTRLYRGLREREAKIRHLVDANIIGIVIWDFDGRILEANDAFLRIVGYDREDLVAGRIHWTDLTPPDWLDRDARAIHEHKMTGTLQPFEKEYFRKDGSRAPILIGAVTFEEGGNEGVAFVLDLTERKYAEEALRESERKFRDYAETASDWFWEIGPDYKFTYLSDNAFGSNGAERIGRPCWDKALDLQTEPEKWRLVWATLDARKPFRDFVYCSVGGNGSPMYVRASGKPVFDANGEFRGYRGTGTDATAIIRAQGAEESLRAVETELARVNRLTTLGELAASIAHEVKQPIAAARNNARAAVNFLVRQPPDLDEVREALECVVDDADRAGHIIDRIRDHVKKVPPRKDRFDLNIAIKEVIVLARSAITANDVTGRTRLAEGLSPVQGDRVQLQQVVLNLILNAVEAMSSDETGARELLISTEQVDPSGIVVAVRDTGPGIAPQLLERVFDPFYTTKASGVGMGLSICRSIVDAHGGRLWADVNEPRGVIFRFTVPRAEEPLTDPL